MSLETAMPYSASGDDVVPYRLSPSVIAVVADEAGARMAREAATLAGARIAETVVLEEAVERLHAQISADVLLIDAATASPDLLDMVMDTARDLAPVMGARIVMVFDTAQIDAVAAHLLGADAQLLCMPTMAERVSAIAVAGRNEPPVLHDRAGEAESERLRRLNDEVARIAETLARLTRAEPGGDGGTVRDASRDYRAAPVDTVAETAIDADTVRSLIRLRRMRGKFFDSALFADPAWDMLLDLFAAGIEGNRVSVSSLCIAADVPPTTALRWIGTMTEAGMFERHADPHDRRRAFIALSDDVKSTMRRYFAAAEQAGARFG